MVKSHIFILHLFVLYKSTYSNLAHRIISNINGWSYKWSSKIDFDWKYSNLFWGKICICWNSHFAGNYLQYIFILHICICLLLWPFPVQWIFEQNNIEGCRSEVNINSVIRLSNGKTFVICEHALFIRWAHIVTRPNQSENSPLLSAVAQGAT